MLRSLILAAVLTTAPPQAVPADYQRCVIIHNGPIVSRKPNFHPYGRRSDDA